MVVTVSIQLPPGSPRKGEQKKKESRREMSKRGVWVAVAV